MHSARDEWLSGWDYTPGIVSIHASLDGRATVWRRIPESGALVREHARFRAWLVLEHIEDLAHLGERLGANDDSRALVRHRELDGSGALRHLVTADDGRALTAAVLKGASTRLGKHITHLAELGQRSVLSLPPEEQYLVATGRSYFRGLAFDQLHRLQFDLETTGLDPRTARVFMISIRYPNGDTEVLEANGDNDAAEAQLIRELMKRVERAEPDVIENHNLHGFDLPFLDERSRALGVPLSLGRVRTNGLKQRAARRGARSADPKDHRRVRFVAPGRELIDTLDAVRRYDFSVRELPGQGLKAVPSIWESLRQTGNTFAATRSIRRTAPIRSVCVDMQRTTSRKSLPCRACLAVRPSRSHRWFRAGMSVSLTPVPQPV